MSVEAVDREAGRLLDPHLGPSLDPALPLHVRGTVVVGSSLTLSLVLRLDLGAGVDPLDGINPGSGLIRLRPELPAGVVAVAELHQGGAQEALAHAT